MKSNWANPEIAKNTRLGLAVLLGSVVLCVWLVIEKFDIEFGQRDELAQSIPIAREVTAEELDALRRGQQLQPVAPPVASSNQSANILPLESKTLVRNKAAVTNQGNAEPLPSIDKDIELTGFESERNPAFAPESTARQTSNPGSFQLSKPLTEPVEKLPAMTKPPSTSPNEDEITQTVNQESSFQPKFPAKEMGSVLPDNSVLSRTSMAESSGGFFQPSAQPPQREMPVAAPQPIPELDLEANSVTEFVARGNETWWMIAQEVYGEGSYFRALYEFNRAQFPEYEVIPAGAKIICPPAKQFDGELARPQNLTSEIRPDPHLQPTYITRTNDTLFGIARQQLGQASRFSEILKLNQKALSRDVGHLTRLDPGILLKLPSQ